VLQIPPHICFQAVVLCQFLPDVDYSVAFGMAQEKMTNDSSDSLYGFVWDLTILEFLINLHSKRGETSKRQQAVSYSTSVKLSTVSYQMTVISDKDHGPFGAELEQ
jgi:integrator complex subunit 8